MITKDTDTAKIVFIINVLTKLENSIPKRARVERGESLVNPY